MNQMQIMKILLKKLVFLNKTKAIVMNISNTKEETTETIGTTIETITTEITIETITTEITTIETITIEIIVITITGIITEEETEETEIETIIMAMSVSKEIQIITKNQVIWNFYNIYIY